MVLLVMQRPSLYVMRSVVSYLILLMNTTCEHWGFVIPFDHT